MLALAIAAMFVGGCASNAADSWLEQCASDAAISASIAECPAGHVIVDVTAAGAAPLRVDITRASDKSFRVAGALGLSPVGEFADWNAVDPRRRAAFDRLAACAAQAPEEFLTRVDARIDTRTTRAGLVLPWRLGAGLLLVAVLIAMWGRRRGGVRVAAELAPLVALALATGLFRWLVLDAEYFHQNGQGPLWLAYASGEPSPYGPGFRELFGAVVSWAPTDPEAALFSAQAIVAALGPVCAWVIARRAGASAALAWAIAAFLALDPMWARLALGESYYASCGSLLLLAGAALSVASTSRIELAVATVAAGLLIAQAARVHPVAWVPAALIPSVLLVADGELGVRVRRVAMVAAGIAVLVAITAAPAMLVVLRGDVGQWMGRVEQPFLSGQFLTLVVVAAALLAMARWRDGAAFPLSVLLAIVAVAGLTSVLGPEVTWIHQSYWRLALVPAIGPAASVLAQLSRTRRARTGLAVAVAAVAVAAAAVQWSRLTELPTDAREAALVRQWRRLVPVGAPVYYVGRAGKRVLYLPWLGRGHQLVVGAEGTDRAALVPGAYYYHSSLCSTDSAAPLCAAIETRELELVVAAELPAIPSKSGFDYRSARIRVGLYRPVTP